MPTAAKLVAALSLAVVAFVVSGQVILIYPENTDFGWFTVVNAALGLIVGWRVIGRGAGRGVAVALSNGITGAVVLLFWGLFVQGVYEMVDRAMNNRYRGPFEAVFSIFELGYEFFLRIAVPEILIALVVGGCVAALLAESAARRWR